MKQYQKAQMIAKNLPSGSYAAGCPENKKSPGYGPKGDCNDPCLKCERTW